MTETTHQNEEESISVEFQEGEWQKPNVVARASAGLITGKYALIHAAEDGTIERAKKLIKLNVNTKTKDNWGQTALHWASHNGCGTWWSCCWAAGPTSACRTGMGRRRCVGPHSPVTGTWWSCCWATGPTSTWRIFMGARRWTEQLQTVSSTWWGYWRCGRRGMITGIVSLITCIRIMTTVGPLYVCVFAMYYSLCIRYFVSTHHFL